MYCQFRHLFGLPVVHAQEAPMASPVPGPLPRMDQVTSQSAAMHVSDAEIQQYLANETGKDRLRAMFKKNDLGKLSPDLQEVKMVTENAALLGLLVGTVMGSRIASAEFIAVNKARVWETKFIAARAYTDTLFIRSLKEGTLMALRIGIFTVLIFGTSQVICVYRNKTSPFEMLAGGALTGGLVRLNLGFRGVIAGSVVGSVLGLVAGVFMYAVRSVTNEKQEEKHYWAVHNMFQEEKRLQMIGESSQTEESDVKES